MPGRQAKVLHDEHLEQLLSFASVTRQPLRNRVIVLLSVKAGLRAGEIAQLTWPMVLGPDGQVGEAIELIDAAAKKSSGRRIPLHAQLRAALSELLLRRGSGRKGPIVRSERGRAVQPAGIVV